MLTIVQCQGTVSGVILCDGTFRQHLAAGQQFPDALVARGLLPGIKVDVGAKPLGGAPGKTVREGLDGLRKTLRVLPGTSSGETLPPAAVAAQTIRTFGGLVPEEVAGIAFLSGGQSPGTATANLAALRQVTTPWPLTFSFGRALVDPALSAWRGDPGRAGDGQRSLANRVACNLAALRGGYRPEDANAYALA